MHLPSGGGFPGGFPSMPGFGGPERDVPARLEELNELHASGALSDAQFDAVKDKLLAEGGRSATSDT